MGEWLKSWVGEDSEILEPDYCFIRGHDLGQDPGEKKTNAEVRWMPYYLSGKIIWIPAPTAVFNTIVELRNIKEKSTIVNSRVYSS